MRKYLSLVLIAVIVSGCQTTAGVHRGKTEQDNAEEILSAVAGAVSGKQLTPEELKQVERQIRTDEEARSAVKAITESVSEPPQVKYCPVTGKRYAADMELCPVHGVKLELVAP